MARKNPSQIAPCNGVEMCGENGTSGTGAEVFEWINIPNALVTTVQFLLKGTGPTDITMELQACVVGGESNPDIVATIDPTTSLFYTIENTAYDRFRINVTAQDADGTGSQALISSRP